MGRGLIAPRASIDPTNDGGWFREHNPVAWASVQPQERDFIEMGIVLFDGAFAKWFFSKLFEFCTNECFSK